MTKSEIDAECESKGMKVALLQSQTDAENLISVAGKDISVTLTYEMHKLCYSEKVPTIKFGQIWN